MQYLKPLMDQNFLEYASYVIKDRAIPDVNDGLKPVQRRILYTMKKIDDGKFNKVANIVGDVMKLHPHGDASIYSALVVLANKEYFIEKQGNFGNILTGDPASAARYIEARLTPLAKELLFNKELTEFVESYDGRNEEPITLPCKIPSTLLLGAEGIAVGMSTRILPHNFNEVLEAQIAFLQNKPFELYPDFLSGGLLDIENYQQGNGKVKSRARIEVVDEKTLIIRELPFGITSESLIQSIQDGVNKGKFKLSSINDYTTDNVAIELKLARGWKVEKLLKSLYAFTQCETVIHVNMLLIQNNQPVQLTTTDVLEYNTTRLVELLELELQLELKQTQQQWHNKRLEQYFIGKRIYKKIEECESYEDVIQTVEKSLKPLQKELPSPITLENIEKLLTIQIKKISKFDLQQSQTELEKLEVTIRSLEKSLKNVTRHTINYLKKLLKKYGPLYSRKTEITTFESIEMKDVVEDQKVGWDKKEGYLGTTVKVKEPILCSPYDRLVIFYTDGRYRIIKVPEKLFIGKNILRIEKVEGKKTYNLIYYEDDSQICYAKRFNVAKFIMDKEYRLFEKKKGAKIVHFSSGSGVMVEVCFVPMPRLKKMRELYRFDDLAIKGISARGNRVSTKAVQKVKIVTGIPAEPAQLSLIQEDKKHVER